jgi:hypothetical protein
MGKFKCDKCDYSCNRERNFNSHVNSKHSIFSIDEKNIDKYCMPKKYYARINNRHYVDLDCTDEYQKEVYVYANKIMKNNNFKKIIDVGCGSGYKLVHYLSNYETIGYETQPCIDHLRKKYPTRTWVDSGQKSKSFNYNKQEKEYDMIMSSDVIEHIVDPDELIKFMKSFKCKYYLFSTPCRKVLTLRNGYDSNGPPKNKQHVREWTFDEFKMYLNKHFDVLESFLGKNQTECQWHLCENKHIK